MSSARVCEPIPIVRRERWENADERIPQRMANPTKGEFLLRNVAGVATWIGGTVPDPGTSEVGGAEWP
eukprot:scaffold766_cov343-Pavlova_lutheri.AAC.12